MRDATKAIGLIGDVDPVAHGGNVVLSTEHGPEVLHFTNHDDDLVVVSRVPIQADATSDLDWADWDAVARYQGRDAAELRADATSPDPVVRAAAYAAVGDYHGWLTLDETPLRLTSAEAEARFGTLVDEAHAARKPAFGTLPAARTLIHIWATAATQDEAEATAREMAGRLGITLFVDMRNRLMARPWTVWSPSARGLDEAESLFGDRFGASKFPPIGGKARPDA